MTSVLGAQEHCLPRSRQRNPFVESGLYSICRHEFLPPSALPSGRPARSFPALECFFSRAVRSRLVTFALAPERQTKTSALGAVRDSSEQHASALLGHK